MKNIMYSSNYTEDFAEKITKQIFLIYELWSIKPVMNFGKVLISGETKDIRKFSDYINNHAKKENPVDLFIYVGNTCKNQAKILHTASAKIIKLTFNSLQRDWQKIEDIHYYSKEYIERIASEIIPIYDLWSIHPSENKTKMLISGRSNEIKEFLSFMQEHANKEYPFNLIFICGVAEKNNPDKMLNSTKKYMKVSFDHLKPDSILKETEIVPKEELKLQLVEISDKLYLEIHHNPNTIIITKELPVEKIIKEKSKNCLLKIWEIFKQRKI